MGVRTGGYAQPMALTRTRLRELHRHELRRVDLDPERGDRPLLRWLTEPGTVPRWAPYALALAWVAVYSAALALEPAPARNGPSPAWGIALDVAMLGASRVAIFGLRARQRLGLVASVAAAGVALVAAVMCPVSGHHAHVGAWWLAQMSGFVGLGGLSLVALRASRLRS